MLLQFSSNFRWYLVFFQNQILYLIFPFYKRFRDLFSDIFKLKFILNLLIANFILNACTALSEGVLRRSSKTPSGAAKRNVCPTTTAECATKILDCGSKIKTLAKYNSKTQHSRHLK